MKEYSSFKEIDRDLEILKLQTQIDKEEIKLYYTQTKENLTPISLIGSILGTIAKKALELKVASKIFGVKRVIASTKN